MMIDAVVNAELPCLRQGLGRRHAPGRDVEQPDQHAGAGGRDDVELDAMLVQRRERA